EALLVCQLIAELFEIHAPDQFHGDVIDAFGFAEVIGLDNIGVNEIGDQLGLADKIIDELFVIRVALADNLDGEALDEVARAVLLGFVNDAHAAFKDLADNL